MYVDSHNNLLFHCRFPCFTVGEAEAAVHSPAKWRSWDLILTLPHADGERCFRGCISTVCLNACIVFFLVCVLKRVVVIIYTVFSHAHTFRKRFCVIFIDPLSCLIIPSFVDYNEFETREHFRFYAKDMSTLGIVRNSIWNNVAMAMYFIFYISFVRIMAKFNFIFPGGRTINHINTNKDKDVCRWLDSIYNLFPSQSKPTESLSF